MFTWRLNGMEPLERRDLLAGDVWGNFDSLIQDSLVTVEYDESDQYSSSQFYNGSVDVVYGLNKWVVIDTGGARQAKVDVEIEGNVVNTEVTVESLVRVAKLVKSDAGNNVTSELQISRTRVDVKGENVDDLSVFVDGKAIMRNYYPGSMEPGLVDTFQSNEDGSLAVWLSGTDIDFRVEIVVGLVVTWYDLDEIGLNGRAENTENHIEFYLDGTNWDIYMEEWLRAFDVMTNDTASEGINDGTFIFEATGNGLVTGLMVNAGRIISGDYGGTLADVYDRVLSVEMKGVDWTGSADVFSKLYSRQLPEWRQNKDRQFSDEDGYGYFNDRLHLGDNPNTTSNVLWRLAQMSLDEALSQEVNWLYGYMLQPLWVS